jgi:hypothetical protein
MEPIMASFREWMQENMEPDTIRDLAEHGASAGWPGLTYYSETGKLYEEFEDEIWQALEDDAGDFGHKTPLEMIASFNGAKDVHSDVQLRNLLVWYLAERTAADETLWEEPDAETEEAEA